MSKRKIILILVGIILVFSSIYSAYTFNLPKWFLFNQRNALKEWEEKVFKNRVLYLVEPQRNVGYLLAKSRKACSGLVYYIKFDPKKYPMMSWRWKVTEFPKKKAAKDTKEGWVERDDYAARVYVIFPSWIFTNIKAIEYVWDENLPVGTVMTSPYLHNIKLIVVESGRKNLYQWTPEERNIAQDYRRAFKGIPKSVGAIALMTDSDNTASSAEALYADIKVGYKK